MFRSIRFRRQPLQVERHPENEKEEEEKSLLDEEFDNERKYESRISSEHIPWKGILLALTLTAIGTTMLSVYICSTLGLISFKPVDSISFLFLAFITLVPGCYHCFIAWKAFRGDEGYSLDDIADLN